MIKLFPDVNAAGTEHRKRLKERFKSGSVEGFQGPEILELLLSYTVPGKDVMSVSGRLLERFGGFRGVLDATPEDLKKAPGLGDNAAILIRLVKELSSVYLKERIVGRDALKSKRDVLNYLNLTLSGERVEKFLAIYLNARNEIAAVETLHEGTINQTVVYPRKAIEKAFKHNAHGVIFVHNHPSGDPTPSNIDRQLAMALDKAAFAVDIYVQDHIIIGKNKHFSARDNGWLTGIPPYGKLSVVP